MEKNITDIEEVKEKMSEMKNLFWDLAEEFVALESQEWSLERGNRMLEIAATVGAPNEAFTDLVKMIRLEVRGLI